MSEAIQLTDIIAPAFYPVHRKENKMPKLINEEGKRYGKLTVCDRSSGQHDKYGHYLWKCICDCGNVCYVKGAQLRNGNTRSCGCLHRETLSERNEKHGLAGSRLYKIYKGMKRRCKSEGCCDYGDYGGRGIKLCAEWDGEHGAENFAKWSLENGYNDNLSIDRIDVNGDYSPDNCRWTDMKTQANNKRSNHVLEHNGERHTLTEWSEITGLSVGTIEARLRLLGWSIERALTTPIRGHK